MSPFATVLSNTADNMNNSKTGQAFGNINFNHRKYKKNERM